MNIIMSLLFFIVVGFSFYGWGALLFPHEKSWVRRLGGGVLLVFILIQSAGYAGILNTPFLFIVLFVGAALWVYPGKLALPFRWGYLLGFIAFLIPLALLPPISRDAVTHHLYQARIWLEFGGIPQTPWCEFFSYPSLVESLYTLAGGTFGFMVSRMVSLLGFFAIGAAVLEFSRKKGDRLTGIIGLLILLTIPELFRNGTWSYSDTWLIFFSLLAYLEFMKENGNPVMAVVWAGGASCCKYNGLIVLAVVLVMLPFCFRRMKLQTITWVSCAVILTTGWWALPNIIQWGNPVYPLLRGAFGPTVDISTRGMEYLAKNAFSSSLNGITDYLLLPIRMSLHGEWDSAAYFDGASGPLLLAGLLFFLFLGRNRIRKLALPVLFIVIALIFSGCRTRYLLPALVMMSIPASATMADLFSENRFKRIIVICLFGICLFWSGMKVVELYTLEEPLEFPKWQTYLEEKTEYYAFYELCDEVVAFNDTTYFVNMRRPFYYSGYAIYSPRIVPLELLEMFWDGKSASEISNEIRSSGAEYIAIQMLYTSCNLVPELNETQLKVWREFMAELEPVVIHAPYFLFKI